MFKLILILLVALVFEAVGVVFLSKGLKQIGELGAWTISEVSRLVWRGLTNPNVLIGVLFEAIFFCGLLVLMSRGDVSFVWPLTSRRDLKIAFRLGFLKFSATARAGNPAPAVACEAHSQLP